MIIFIKIANSQVIHGKKTADQAGFAQAVCVQKEHLKPNQNTLALI
jgi:hypothetical protein